jgi:hypothetical protein
MEAKICKVKCPILEIRLGYCECYDKYLANKPKKKLTEVEKKYLKSNKLVK